MALTDRVVVCRCGVNYDSHESRLVWFAKEYVMSRLRFVVGAVFVVAGLGSPTWAQEPEAFPADTVAIDAANEQLDAELDSSNAKVAAQTVSLRGDSHVYKAHPYHSYGVSPSCWACGAACPSHYSTPTAYYYRGPYGYYSYRPHWGDHTRVYRPCTTPPSHESVVRYSIGRFPNPNPYGYSPAVDQAIAEAPGCCE